MVWNRRPLNKYGNRKVTIQGEKYHSASEGMDGLMLADMQKKGEIKELKRQVRYKCYHNGDHITDSLVDFQFVHVKTGTLVWYEHKGFETKDYLIKRRLIEADMKDKENEVYLVNSVALHEWMRGRLSRV